MTAAGTAAPATTPTSAPAAVFVSVSFLIGVVGRPSAASVIDVFAAFHVVFLFLRSRLDDGVEIFLQGGHSSLQLVVLLQHAPLLNAREDDVARTIFRQQLFHELVHVSQDKRS